MTMVVGMHLGYYVLLAADSRVTWRYVDAPPSWEDGVDKVYPTVIGLLSGAGSRVLIHAVRDKCLAADPHIKLSIVELDQMLRDARAETLPDTDDERTISSHNNTAWLATYLNSTLPPLEWIRLVRLHGSGDGTYWRYDKGDVALLGDIGEQHGHDLYAYLREEMVPLSNEDGLDPELLNQSIIRHMSLAANAIAEVAEESERVSEGFQIGVHTQLHQFAVSNVMTKGSDGWSDFHLTLPAAPTPEATEDPTKE